MDGVSGRSLGLHMKKLIGRMFGIAIWRLPAKLDVPPFTSITGKMNVRPAVAASVLPTVAEEVHFKAPIKAATTLLRSYASVRGWQPTPQQIGANVAASRTSLRMCRIPRHCRFSRQRHHRVGVLLLRTRTSSSRLARVAASKGSNSSEESGGLLRVVNPGAFNERLRVFLP